MTASMTSGRAHPIRAFALAASVALSACGGGAGGASSLLAGGGPLQHKKHGSGSSPIQHVVLMIQENRTFNDFFATFPGAVGSTTGYELVKTGNTYVKTQVTLTEVKLERKGNGNFSHIYPAFLTAYQNGDMDGFNLVKARTVCRRAQAPYQYVNPAQIAPYWDIASQWGLADEMFQTQGSEQLHGSPGSDPGRHLHQTRRAV